MEFSQSRQAATRFDHLAEAGSTNDVLVSHATGLDAGAWPDFSVIVTDNQTSGRGRLGRVWQAPSGKSLAISVLLRPTGLTPNAFGWFPLLAGAAMTRAARGIVEDALQSGGSARLAGASRVAGALGASRAGETPLREEENPSHDVSLKWPNDVLIDGYKVSGILCELLSDGRGLVIGAGVNVSLDEHDLPTVTSTSLLLATNGPVDPDAVLVRYLTELRTLTDAFIASGGDAVASGSLAAVTELCGTLGSHVRVELPGGEDLLGVATGLDPQGRLIVADEATAEARFVAAGDVTHLRY
ncbi:biotin--[acetyl-CoA-carboxylase] ligase [Leifsonia kafniensis]|uniref:biotin--[biotin carboxyl-carrier protein] ligase n=1 Tax=Leifsonia kafniensis TaxID=475957 RepID=A0ABP7KEB5_9MICO